MKIVAFGASYSSKSINRQLAAYAASQFENADAEVLNLLDFVVPMFTEDVEAAKGHPEHAKRFVAKLEEADLLIISLGEHNGSYEAAFKNLFDWASRIKAKTFEGAKMLLMATSPGGRGGQGVLAHAMDRFPRHGAEVVANFSLPSFGQNFTSDNGIIDATLKHEFDKVVASIKTQL
jgi:NAD(P)H-dependent FMN reductase